MECYLHDLPTTGSISFAEICLDPSHKYVSQLAAATSSRTSMRAALKESRRTDGEKDYLKLVKVFDDYLPHLYAVINAINSGELALKAEPVFSWRTTLSSNVFHSSPRISTIGFPAELAFSLLAYAFATCNLARSNVLSLGDYEHERHIIDSERRAKDEKLSVAVSLLCRASGIFSYIAEKVLPQWEIANPELSSRVPDLNKDVITSLSHLTLSDAQMLAIRKLLSKSAYDALLSPGPPLPKSHPSPVLVAKLYLHVASLYSSARSLAKSHKEGEISLTLRKYLACEGALALALAHKWLGVDAGESGSRGGDAVAFLKWSKAELEELKEGGIKISLGRSGDNKKPNKSRIVDEIDTVTVFLKNYQKINDSVHFQAVPPQSALQSMIPTGRSAVAAKPFEPPRPTFGPSSPGPAERSKDATPSDTSESASQGIPSYAGAGSYF